MSRSLELVCALAAGALAVGCSQDPVKIAVTVTPSGSIQTDGHSAATITATLSQGGKALESGTVTFRTAATGVAFAPIDDPQNVNYSDAVVDLADSIAGQVAANLYSVKNATVTVAIIYADDTLGLKASQAVSIPFGTVSGVAIATFEFVSANPTSIGLSGSGNNATSVVTFLAKDSSGNPVPQGLDVAFLVSKDIATIDPATAKTNPQGEVSATVRSGTSVGSVKVQVTSGDASAESLPIIIAGGVANYNDFTISCNRFAIGGFGKFGLRMTCHAFVADLNGQKLANTDVSFVPEAGAMAPTVTTDENGTAENVYKTQEPYPKDVDPADSKTYNQAMPPIMQSPLDNGVEPRVANCNWKDKVLGQVKYVNCNPRDGLVTIIAMTAGQEQYTDANNNHRYDLGEPFVDLPEPYVDVNDDGQFNEGEPFSDTNGNGRWDGANGKWDESTTIWKATKIVWTDEPSYGGIYQGNASVDSLAVPHCGSTAGINVGMWDAFFNKMAQEDGDEVSCMSSRGAFTVNPASLVVNNGRYGHNLMGSFELVDSHSCPCVPPDCVASTDGLACNGQFTAAQDAEDKVDIIIYLPVVPSVPLTVDVQ